ncbi:hypothetical protein [Haloferula sargassicola]|uniref:hypothetical protein n=1 Tax=Haloferula sargassicola TaxID=490096 RepID=UPI003365A2B3
MLPEATTRLKESEFSGEWDAPDVKRDALAVKRDAPDVKRDALAVKRDALAGKRDALAGKRDALAGKRDALAGKRDALAVKRDALAGKRDALVVKRDALAGKRDSLAGKRDANGARGDASDVRGNALDEVRFLYQLSSSPDRKGASPSWETRLEFLGGGDVESSGLRAGEAPAVVLFVTSAVTVAGSRSGLGPEPPVFLRQDRAAGLPVGHGPGSPAGTMT